MGVFEERGGWGRNRGLEAVGTVPIEGPDPIEGMVFIEGPVPSNEAMDGGTGDWDGGRDPRERLDGVEEGGGAREGKKEEGDGDGIGSAIVSIYVFSQNSKTAFPMQIFLPIIYSYNIM